ncbi:stress-induced protein KIN2-like [Durio zibethinus]|uniref:Stress-induced protein KIN2-like n=1 Tax=Durio zibethinus TaxID=66656 RepID=A0A6P6A4P2_DURZI|nr:stress-induced protein KIN2-like [Durio zibethinus]
MVFQTINWKHIFTINVQHIITVPTSLISNFTAFRFQIQAPNMSDNSSQSISYQAGEAKGHAQEKGSSMMDRAANAAQSAKESMQETRQQMMDKAQGAKEAVKDATGMNK